MGSYTLIISLIVLVGGGSFANVEAMLTVGDETIHGAPALPVPLKEYPYVHAPENLGWEKRFFEKPVSQQFDIPKRTFRSQSGLGLSLKSPGRLPGIEFGVEMHSLGALQSVVPLERLPKSLNFQQEQLLVLPRSHLAPDYNGGFFRFTW